MLTGNSVFDSAFFQLTVRLAWAAGLFEGEGSFTVHRSRNPTRKDGFTNVNAYPCAQLQMTDKDVMDKFVEIVGVGKVNGPYLDKRGARKPKYSWQVINKEAIQVINMLKPFLRSRRREQIETVLSDSHHFVSDDPKYRRIDNGSKS